MWKKRKIGMRKKGLPCPLWRRYLPCLLCLALMAALPGCGKEEPLRRVGVDGYVYVATSLPWVASGQDREGASNRFENVSSLRTAGDWLYYLYYGSLMKLPLGEELDFSLGQHVPVDVAGASCFAVDAEGNVYWFQRNYGGLVANGTGATMELLAGGSLYKASPDGRRSYQLELDGGMDGTAYHGGLAADGQGRAYLLMDDGIHVVGAEGAPLAVVPTQDYQGEETSGRLCGNGSDAVYYCVGDANATRVLEVTRDGTFGLKEVEAVPAGYFTSICAARDGGLLLADGYGMSLLRYDKGEDAVRTVLYWTDSGLVPSAVSEVADLGGEGLLALYDGTDGMEACLLSRTPVEEAERELVVLASPFGTDNLVSDAVADFNRQSGKYRVVVETYGYEGDEGDALRRMNADLVSREPPDLMDLYGLDLRQYADQGVLEDLAPYLEGSGSLGLDAYLENVVEGCTVDGKLVCLPKYFSIPFLLGRKGDLAGLSGWGLEDFQRLFEENPGKKVAGYLCDTEWFLGEVCAPYILERFIGEDGSCSFDGGEFADLLEWAKGFPLEKRVIYTYELTPEDCLLRPDRLYCNYTYLEVYNILSSGEAAFMGYPSADGEGVYKAEADGLLGMTAASQHKEGAWAFLEFYFGRNEKYLPGFPARKDLFEEAYAKGMEPIYETRADGTIVGVMQPTTYIEGERVPVDYPTQEQVDEARRVAESADFTQGKWDRDVMEVIVEEADGYFNGDRTLEDVVRNIQSRVELIISESQ